MVNDEADMTIGQILMIEPRIRDVIATAAAQINTPGYNRIRTYVELRNRTTHLVGWMAHEPKLKTSICYDVVIRTIDDLLPPDDVDLYPDGRPE